MTTVAWHGLVSYPFIPKQNSEILWNIRHWVTYLRSSLEWHAIVCHPLGLLWDASRRNTIHTVCHSEILSEERSSTYLLVVCTYFTY